MMIRASGGGRPLLSALGHRVSAPAAPASAMASAAVSDTAALSFPAAASAAGGLAGAGRSGTTAL